MKNNYLVYLGCICLLTLAGCSNGSIFSRGEPDITGYVMDSGGDSILVVYTVPTDQGQTNGLGEYYDAVWVSDVTESVEVGEQVSVWFEGGIAESYPAQTQMGNLEIVDSPRPEGADLSETEALKEALSQESINAESLAVRSIAYEDSEDEWLVVLRNIHTFENYNVQVADQDN
ncbi:MAG: YobA family protein [Alkalibacterium sp.]|nr:YobA family protein [Alkalibacterium sp.]